MDCCGKDWSVVLIGKNCAYKCEICQSEIEVAACLRKWQGVFPYSPLIGLGTRAGVRCSLDGPIRWNWAARAWQEFHLRALVPSSVRASFFC